MHFETWLHSFTPDSFVSIPHFNIFRHDQGRGGGVCIYVRDDLKATVLHVDMERMEGVDDLWLTIQNLKLPSFIIGCVYRHPKAVLASFDYLLDIFRIMSIRNKPLFIL